VSWYKKVPGQPAIVRTAGQLSVTGDQIHDLRIETATSIAEPYGSQPTQLHLHPVFPNPFNASATLAYELPQDGVTELAIYTVLGQRVRRLVATRQAAGRHLAVWDGRDDRGTAVGSGVYLVRLSAQGTTRVGRMALIR